MSASHLLYEEFASVIRPPPPRMLIHYGILGGDRTCRVGDILPARRGFQPMSAIASVDIGGHCTSLSISEIRTMAYRDTARTTTIRRGTMLTDRASPSNEWVYPGRISGFLLPGLK